MGSRVTLLRKQVGRVVVAQNWSNASLWSTKHFDTNFSKIWIKTQTCSLKTCVWVYRQQNVINFVRLSVYHKLTANPKYAQRHVPRPTLECRYRILGWLCFLIHFSVWAVPGNTLHTLLRKDMSLNAISSNRPFWSTSSDQKRNQISLIPIETRKNAFIICWLWHKNQVSEAGIGNYISQFTVECNYLSLPEIPAFVAKVLMCSQYHAC